VWIELDSEDVLRIRPVSGLLRYYGAARRFKKPLSWKQIERIAHEDHAINAAREGLD